MDLNGDCMFAIIQQLDDGHDPEAVTTRENCKDKIALSTTCSFFRSLVLESDECSSYWNKLEYHGREMYSFCSFLWKVKDWVENLDVWFSPFLSRTDIRQQYGYNDEALAYLCGTFPVLKNVWTLSVCHVGADALLPKVPSLRNFKGRLDFKLPAQDNCSPMLEEIELSGRIGDDVVGNLKTFLVAHARLEFVKLPRFSANEPVLLPWLSTPEATDRLTTLHVGSYRFPDIEVTQGIAKCRNLESLRLCLGNLTDAAFPHLGRLEKLHTLRLRSWGDHPQKPEAQEMRKFERIKVNSCHMHVLTVLTAVICMFLPERLCKSAVIRLAMSQPPDMASLITADLHSRGAAATLVRCSQFSAYLCTP